ncbi:hypothetical protein GCM10022254_41130 [Actinomadura meridiana]|uniref:WXG100 family type VII secretion target n=1 Tax=Actinomadura meridiana TaxID=559626 RepID=A0ABP8C7D0_9ACTN
MSGPLAACKGLAEASMYECIFASIVIPAAIPMNQIVYQAQGDPQKIWDAADGWKETIDELQKAKDELDSLTHGVQQMAWQGDDRTAFEKRIKEYGQQLDAAIAMAWAVAISLWILAVMIGVFIFLMFVIVSLLAIFAAAISIAAGSIIGAPAALEMEAQANQFASMAYRILSMGSKVLTITFGATAGIYSLALAGNMAWQWGHGNDDVGRTFGQATVNGLDDMIKGTLGYLEQKFTGRLMGEVPVGTWTGIPQASRIAPLTGLERGATGLGAVDTRNGGPVLVSGGEKLAGAFGLKGGEYGSGENGEPDPGRKYVDDTQPTRE